MNEGSTLNMIAYNNLGVAEDITWKSSNTAAAIISDTGVVTGIKAGKTIITATDSEGETISTTLYVTIPDGVYRIKNQYSQLYMGIQNPSNPNSGIPVQQNLQTEGYNYIGQLWQVKYTSGGNYIVSPMHRVYKYLFQNNGSVYTNNMTSLEKDNPSIINGVAISFNGTGYVIHDSVELAYSLAPENNLPSSTIVAAAYSSASVLFQWDFELIPGIFFYSDTGTGIPSGEILYVECGENPVLANTIVSGTGNLNSACTWHTNNDGINPVNMSTGQITTQKRAATVVAVSTAINNTLYISEINVVCKETVYVKNYYDSTIDLNLLNQIESAVLYLNTIYSQDYYLYFVMDGLPVSYQNSGVDICPQGNTSCCSSTPWGACGEDCTQHHKNVHRIADDLYTRYWNPNTVIVMWSNCQRAVYCCQAEGLDIYGNIEYFHKALSSYALVTLKENESGALVHQPVIQMLTINNRDEFASSQCTDVMFMSIVLAHEVAHTLGLVEMYDNEDYPDHDGNTGMQCIMEYADLETIDDIYRSIKLGEGAFCPNCIYELTQCIPDNAYEN